MTRLGTRRRHQDAVLFAIERYGMDGSPILSDGSALKVRIEEGRPLIGSPNAATAAIDIAMWVNQAIEVGSLIWIGLLSDLGTADPTNLKEVVDCQIVPDIKGRTSEYVLLLKKWSNKP